jgi:hypothetical protein
MLPVPAVTAVVAAFLPQLKANGEWRCIFAVKVMARHRCVGDGLQEGLTGADGVLCPNQLVLLAHRVPTPHPLPLREGRQVDII